MEIPTDIKAAAKAAYEAMPLCYDGWDEDAVILCIARAILAERERATQAERDRVNAMWDRGNAADITGEET